MAGTPGWPQTIVSVGRHNDGLARNRPPVITYGPAGADQTAFPGGVALLPGKSTDLVA